MDGLPDDAIVEIFARVPIRSLYRSRCVAKAWRDLIDHPLHRKKLPQTLEGFFINKVIFDGGQGSPYGFINLLARSVPLNIDPAFSFLTELPGIEALILANSCNGLLQHYRKSLLVFPTGSSIFSHTIMLNQPKLVGFSTSGTGRGAHNPATKQWGAVPTCGCPHANFGRRIACLAFDPAVSSHFHLFQIWKEGSDEEIITVYTYSSETRTRIHSQTDEQEDQGQLEGWRHTSTLPDMDPGCAFVKGMLHLTVLNQYQRQIVVVDVQGKTRKIITAPAVAVGRHMESIVYFGQSQGRMHYMNQEFDALEGGYGLYTWMLQDYDTQEWVLKGTVSFLKLLGRKSCPGGLRVVAIHQDCNVVFFYQPLNLKLMAYDVNRKVVSVIACFENLYTSFAPYIPYFLESPALTSHK